MAVDDKLIGDLEEQIKLLEGLEAEVSAAIKRARAKVELLRQGVPKEDQRIFPPKG
ncbi:MAG TPA: hypothetical protein VM686_23320 [Polyangiaceae bacterium]|nr:hypothetical protein [Polyangiaceae bacterium]